MDENIKENSIVECTKQEAKQEAKKQINKKFYVGDIYYIKNNINKKYYKLIKYIYSDKTEIVNALIMLQVGGEKSDTIYTLTQKDCKRYHIKYQPGLQVFSMTLNWIHKKGNKQTKSIVSES